MGRGYSIFDTAIGRCGIAWGELGVIGVQLPQAREIETRRRLFQFYPEAREQRPPRNARSRSRASSRYCAATRRIFRKLLST